nr:MAG TPA: hypothetical protein [Caudoviricetes sp.]
MNKIRFKGLEDIVLMSCPNTVKGRMKRALMRIYYALCRYNNAKQLEFICNLHPCYEGRLTSDQSKLLDKLSEYVKASPFITKKLKTVYVIPNIEKVTLWQLIETRRAETATEKVTKWCTPVEGQTAEYSPDNVYHLLTAMKYIREQIKTADDLERTLFPQGAGGPDAEPDTLKEAKNILTLVQATAELFNCSFEEAKRINYLDAILALSKRHEEVEKEKAEMKKHFNK